MAGVGDLLALFRCISCRHYFGTDVRAPLALGTPGRVFTSAEVPPTSTCASQVAAVGPASAALLLLPQSVWSSADMAPRCPPGPCV